MKMKNIILVIALLFCPMHLLALEAPPLTGRINDQAGLLKAETKQRLDKKLAAFEAETSNQVVVLTIPTLDGDDIDQFSIRVAEAWKLGQKGKDNGVLLVLAKTERKVRIEVGMGLQGVLPDITAGKIIRETMRPHLKAGDFDQGITVAVDSIIAATKGEFKGTGQTAKKQGKKSSSSFAIYLIIAAAVAAALGYFSRYLGAAAGAVGLPLAASMAFSGMGLFMLFLLAAGGLVAGFLLSMLVSSILSGGGFYGGGWGGGFFGGSSSSSGSNDSFSGGGGDFDGGGSSDDY